MNDVKMLEEIAQRPLGPRAWQYLKLSGPGWLQGAMTLGGGSAITSLTIGAVYGYELLWVQPVSMLIGCVMLFALSHQTLSTGEKPYQAMRKYLHPSLAWFWAVAALLSSIIWGFSHYPLSAGMFEELISVTTGFDLKSEGGLTRELYLFVLAILIWALCATTAWHYGKGGRTVFLFENAVKILSGMIVLCFAWVVFESSLRGQIDWGAALRGYVPSSLPSDGEGMTTVMAALGTAVGINMTFVYGYTLLNRDWGKAHRELARYDILIGLVLPYLLVTGLMSIAAAGVLYGGEATVSGRLNPETATRLFAEGGISELSSRLIFSLGILGMAIGSLVMHMLCCGSAAAELFGWEHQSRKYQWALLLPTPAVLGVFLWSSMGPYVILPTSAICGLLLPIAYLGWLLLNNKRSYLGDDMPVGNKRVICNVAMLLCIATVLASVIYTIVVKLSGA